MIVDNGTPDDSTKQPLLYSPLSVLSFELTPVSRMMYVLAAATGL